MNISINYGPGFIVCLVVLFISFCIGGSLLVYYNYNYNYICPECHTGYDLVIINMVKTCINVTSVNDSYNQCYHYENEPGFGIGITMLVIIWLIIGAPFIVIIPIDGF